MRRPVLRTRPSPARIRTRFPIYTTFPRVNTAAYRAAGPRPTRPEPCQSIRLTHRPGTATPTSVTARWCSQIQLAKTRRPTVRDAPLSLRRRPTICRATATKRAKVCLRFSSGSHPAYQLSFPCFHRAGGGGGGASNSAQQQPQTTSCTVSNGRTTAPGPGQAPGPGAFGLYPSQHPGMVAIDPMALGLFPGVQTNNLLYANRSQIAFDFSPTPNLPSGFPTTFTIGDIAGGTPSPRVGGTAFDGFYDFDIYGLPSDAAARAATSQPVAVTVTFPSSLPINCGGPATDPILPPPGEVPAFKGVVHW